ncbi:hypothetical protein [Helicobacter macacae]|uniref:Uncharacterized protein n=1 Tax=Helicobacter macacae MIT 99-5501 TaxID=1357400 RepID=V8C4F2_9HELI|nr:hypothetical protein [Helicobacter macacae]ETD22254.1 hypothetical protein HMPREF2086_01985 [Helicobacter macacae MIT 99-5501]
MPHISIKRLAYFDGEVLLNYALTPIKSKASLTRISCVGYENLILCSVQEKELKKAYDDFGSSFGGGFATNTTEGFAKDFAHFSRTSYASVAKSNHAQNAKTTFISSIASVPDFMNLSRSQIEIGLYHHCLKGGILEKNVDYVLSFMRLKSGVFKVFALEKEQAHCDIIVPLLLLPFGIEAMPSGVFLLHNWLMFYENGDLLYDCYCDSGEKLEEALHFLRAAYGKQNPEVAYLGGFIQNHIERHNQAQSKQNQKKQDNEMTQSETMLPNAKFTHKTPIDDSKQIFSQDLEVLTSSSLTQLTPLSSLAPLSPLLSLASFSRLDSSVEKLCFDFVLQSVELSDMASDMDTIEHSLQSRANFHKPKPLYNKNKKHLFQTQSFWSGLKALACCAIVLVLPFCKLGYAKYTQSKATSLKEQNENALALAKQERIKNAMTSRTLESLDSALHLLATLHSPYTPKLEIISKISSIASKSSVWIGALSLQENDEIQNLDLSIYANEEGHIEVFLQELSKHFALIDSTSYAKDDIFAANISAMLASKVVL